MMDENQDSLSAFGVCLQAWNRLESLDTIFEEPEEFFCENDTD